MTALEVLVLAIAGGGLFFLPGPTASVWPWEVAPFTARFLGASYLAALVALGLMLVVGRWAPGWNTLWVVFGFTTLVLVNSLIEVERFDFSQPGTWAWFALYAILPTNAAYHLWRYWPGPPPGRLPGYWPAVLRVGAALFALYTVGLLALPAAFTGFWPWPGDGFHARTYSAAFASLALGCLLTARSGRVVDLLTTGLTLLTFSTCALAGLLLVDADRDALDWSAVGTWLWAGGFGALVALSLLMLTRLRQASRWPVRRGRSPARSSALARGFALAFGAAFTAAGISGFLPAFTSDPPAGAADLELTSGYGYLLGLYPVNAMHSLLHLGFGLTGLAAYGGKISIGRYARAISVSLGLLTVMGLLPGLRTTFGLLPLYGHDVWLHALEAAIAGYIGFVVAAPARPPDRALHDVDGAARPEGSTPQTYG